MRAVVLPLAALASVALFGACSGGSSSPGVTPDDAGPSDGAGIDGTASDGCAPSGCGPAASCTDGVKNGGESDTDCGGAACPPCAIGAACAAGTDCQTGHCEAHVCDVASCGDGAKNGDETDVDCGGSCANKCAPGQGCGAPADCRSLVCTNKTCAAATCTDNVRNGAETDTDCGGSCPVCALGKLCLLGGDCASGVCANRCVECVKGTDCAKRVCAGNACITPGAPPSCAGLAATCSAAGNVDCCDSPVVTGSTFMRSYDGTYFTDTTNPATVADFKLDHFEATVARFRKYVAGYPANRPTPGDGANPSNPADPGWDNAWTANLAATQAQLMTNLSQASCGGSTWTDTAGANENQPINCLTWYEAYAFCIWDQARLPTEAEWNYAAAGGTDQRIYPWPNKTPELAPTDALYAPAAIGNVGSLAGVGKYGQSDMAGNVWEWTQDGIVQATPAYPRPCANCADLTDTAARVLRGGSTNGAEPTSDLRVSYRGSVDPANRYFDQGVRCARVK